MDAPETPTIDARGVVKRYGSFTAVDGVSLRVTAGTCYALLGPNGAGKSTLSRVLGAVSRRDGGDLRVFGLDPSTHAGDVKARLGWVMQDDALDEELDVLGNLCVWGGFYGLSRAESARRAADVLRQTGLEGKETARIAALSGGMRRRLVIARALLPGPELLVLDEPTTGLDPQVRHAIWGLLRTLRGRGATLLLTTHFMEEAAWLADRVGVLHKGRMADEGTPAELLARHVRRYALEVRDAPAGLEERLGTAGGPLPGALVRRHGDFVTAYDDDEGRLRSVVAAEAFRNAQVRPSTLEDVFLELTGRTLEDAA